MVPFPFCLNTVGVSLPVPEVSAPTEATSTSCVETVAGWDIVDI